MSLLNALLDLPPREIIRLLRRRVARSGPAWTADELLAHSSKHRRGERLIDVLLRWSAASRIALHADPLRIDGARVLEIGCGPLGGFAPVAAFLGARSFDAVDPEFDPALLSHPRVVEEYLLPLHSDLTAVHGPLVELQDFARQIGSILRPHRTTLEVARPEEPPDLVLSMSCLEHVFPLESVPRALARMGAQGARQAHLVDYSNHHHTSSPFDGIYDTPPEAYIARRGQAINLARSPDIRAAFDAAGMPLRVAMRRQAAMPRSRKPNEWWSVRYTPEELSTHVELLVRVAA